MKNSGSARVPACGMGRPAESTTTRRHRAVVVALASLTLLTSCDWMPGYPKESERWQPESAVTDFSELYRENCLACHSENDTPSASIPMNFPRYLHFIPTGKLRSVIVHGVPGAPMPGFAPAAGGSLTDEQIDSLVTGISAWKTGAPPANLPAYEAALGDPAAGATAYSTHCASCHGADGLGGTASSVLATAYLGLVSDQYLRTVTVVGRPHLGMPPTNLADPEVADIVAWLASHRRTSPSPTVQTPSRSGDLESPSPTSAPLRRPNQTNGEAALQP